MTREGHFRQAQVSTRSHLVRPTEPAIPRRRQENGNGHISRTTECQQRSAWHSMARLWLSIHPSPRCRPLPPPARHRGPTGAHLLRRRAANLSSPILARRLLALPPPSSPSSPLARGCGAPRPSGTPQAALSARLCFSVVLFCPLSAPVLSCHDQAANDGWSSFSHCRITACTIALHAPSLPLPFFVFPVLLPLLPSQDPSLHASQSKILTLGAAVCRVACSVCV